jgi:hypothetical protein
MKFDKQISLQPSPYTDPNTNKIVTPEAIVLDELDVTYMIRPLGQTLFAQIRLIQTPILLASADSFLAIQSWDTQSLNSLLKDKLGEDPQSYLQSLFPKTLESDPNGPGSILTNMISTMGIKSTSNCSCRRHALEMNEKGPDWCEQNINTILSWLKEESTKRKLPYVEAVAKLIVNRAIKTSRRLKSQEIT